MKLPHNIPLPYDLIAKYAQECRPVDYAHGLSLYFYRLPNEDAYECSFTFKITATAAEEMMNEIKLK